MIETGLSRIQGSAGRACGAVHFQAGAWKRVSTYQSQIRRSRCEGYSLLEVLLALALSVAVFAAIAMAIQTYLASLTRQKVMIERKQIARAVLVMMSNDLRAGIQYKAADYSGLDNLIATQNLMSNSLLNATDPTSEESEETGETGLPPSESDPPPSSGSPSSQSAAGSTADSEEETASIVNEDEVSFRPALIGSDQVIMTDISRLPRLDQYNPLVASAQSLMQSPSDVKSIAYFFSASAGGMTEEIEFDSAAPGGLYRREIDRAVAAYQGETEMLSSPDSNTKLLASEVAEVRFRYFDGSDWQTSWDSAETGGFPVAIEITLVIDPARSSVNNTTYSYGGFDQTTMESFRTVVHLLVAEPIEE